MVPATHTGAPHPTRSCLLYLFSCALERSWRFLFPIALLSVSPLDTLWAISLLSVASSLACSLLGPVVGRLLDQVWRPLGLATLLVVQDVCIATKAALLATAPTTVPLTQQQARFGLFLVCCCLEKLTAIASELEVERDWVSRLAGGAHVNHAPCLLPRLRRWGPCTNFPCQPAAALLLWCCAAGKTNVVSLANSNSWLRRMDLAMEASGAFAFGWMSTTLGVIPSLVVASALGLAVIPVQLFFIARIARLAPEAMLHGGEEFGQALVKPPEWHAFIRMPRGGEQQQAQQQPLLQRLRQQAEHAMDGW